MKKTKIVATLGPASDSAEMIEDLVKSGVNVFRLNFSHGSHEEHAGRIEKVRDVSRRLGRYVGILADLQGPKIRIGEYDGFLHKNEEIILSCGEAANGEVPVQYKNLFKDVKIGDSLLLDDGLLELKVQNIINEKIYTKVITGGRLTSKKGINLPTGTISAEVVTEKDIRDAKFALSKGADFLALSFVRDAGDIEILRNIIIKSENPNACIVAKIERHEAVKNFEQILAASDAIMVARGDLGIEVSQQKVPLIQKQIIKRCLAVGKPSIVATQMLDSMIRNPRSTRAETSDIANAILDGADAVMLSGETANGSYPKQAVKAMHRIAVDTEAWITEQKMNIGSSVKRDTRLVSEAIAQSAVTLAKETGSRYLVAATSSGNTALSVSKFRPNQILFAGTENEKTARKLTLSWGVYPFVFDFKDNRELMEKLVDILKNKNMIKPGDKVTLVSGITRGKIGGTNMLRINTVE